MANKKEKKTSDVQQKLAAARQLRLEQAEKLGKAEAKKEVKDHKEEWSNYWTKNRKAYGESKEIGEIIWLHLKAIGCDKPEKFEEGIKNFGINKGDK
jgi:predicted urease superfamily metal-dependent hydrolase